MHLRLSLPEFRSFPLSTSRRVVVLHLSLFVTDQLNQLLLLTRKTHHLYIKDNLCISRNTRLSRRSRAAFVTKGKFTLSRTNTTNEENLLTGTNRQTLMPHTHRNS
jgi:hypothetical protein